MNNNSFKQFSIQILLKTLEYNWSLNDFHQITGMDKKFFHDCAAKLSLGLQTFSFCAKK